ncbi:MAG: Endoglucanase C [Chlamydiia bacterium]|nr:Endoglucanase C [Chlamydiia bacterium]MCH9616625.1 Endoglucanase C [Chlamydiia bacterium]MCH9629355.1 Endoglucanase C [Chlamydiia bacterium]
MTNIDGVNPHNSHFNPIDPINESSETSLNPETTSDLDHWCSQFIAGWGSSSSLSQCRVNFDNTSSGVMSNSEGTAYALRLLVHSNEKDIPINFNGKITSFPTQKVFGALFSYAKSKFDTHGLMNWEINSSGAVVGKGSATDADMGMAYALMQAGKKWPSDSEFNYTSEAHTMLQNIFKYDVFTKDGKPMILPGDNWGTAGQHNFDPSYVDPTMWMQFAEFDKSAGDNWSALTSNCLAEIAQSANPTTGLIPDWCDTTNPQDKAPNFPKNLVYSFDACRVPMRLAGYLQAVSTTDANAKEIIKILTPMMNTFIQKTGGTHSLSPEGYKLDGNPIGSPGSSPAFDAPVAYALDTLMNNNISGKPLYTNPKGASLLTTLNDNVNKYMKTMPGPYSQQGSSPYYNSVLGLLAAQGY